MEKYQSYKPSGVEWIGDIPKDWVIGKLKHNSELNISSIDKHIYEDEISVKVCNYTDVYYNEFISKSLELRIGSCTPEEYKKNLLKKGDVIITKDSESSTDIGVPSIVIDDLDNVVCGYHLSIIKSNSEKLIGSYLFRQLQTTRVRRYFEINSNGITRFGLGKSSVLDLPLILPPISEQNQIVQFLDEKTELIDKLISTKEQKISLLKEQRTSLINQVVTKGLNPNVKMKDSGVEWIGEIPLHWMISKFKFDSSSPVQYGLNISGDKYQEEGIRFIRITDLTEEGELIKEDGKYLDENEVPSEFLLNKWDVLFCRSGHTVGKSYLHKEDGKFTSGGYLVRFNFRNYFESKFIFYIGKTSFYWDWIKLNSVVSTIENVNGDKYQNFQYPKPPIQEQQSIVEFLDKRTKEIDDLVSLEQKKIDLLKEYRQSLISEVVTGKVKVTQ
jgi:type I restriction enzyme S subunit